MLWSTRKVSVGILDCVGKEKDRFGEWRSRKRRDWNNTSPKGAYRAKGVLGGTSNTSGGIVTVGEGFQGGQTKEGCRTHNEVQRRFEQTVDVLREPGTEPRYPS